MKKLFAVMLTIAMVSAMLFITISAESSDAAGSATIVCYVEDSTGENFSYTDSVNVKAYLFTGTDKTKLSDFTVISSSTSIDSATNVHKIELANIDTTTALDTAKIYLCFDIQNYTVSTVQSEYIDLSKKIQVKDETDQRVFTFYNIDAKYTTIEGNETYNIGIDNSLSPGVNFTSARGTITGTVLNSDGDPVKGAEVTVTDPVRDESATVLTNVNGNYSLSFYTGEYEVKFDASTYNIVTKDLHFYDDDSYDPLKNKQSAVQLTKLSGNATIVGYISNTNGTNFDKVSSIEISVYYQKSGEYELLSTTNAIKTVKTETRTYYTFTLEKVSYKAVEKCYLYINMTGYSVGIVQTDCLDPEPYTLSKTVNVAYKFNLGISDTGYFEPGLSYSIGSELMPGVQMKSAKGTITGQVITDTSTPASLNGVTVNIYDLVTDALIASGITSGDGNYSITCSTGNYKITASINDYKTYTGEITVYDDQYNPELNKQQPIKLSSSETLFGTDLPHVLMAVGLIVALILIIIVTIHRLKFFGKGINIYDDEKEEKK